MKRSCHVAVLGAGIMGSTTALLLARKGLSTTLFDAAPAPMSRASRWNEGKIHLGFLYAADSSLETVRRLMPGGLAFKPLMEQLIGTSLDRCSTTDDEIYLIHRDSVVSAEAAASHFAQVADLLRHAAGTRDYLVDVSNPKVQKLIVLFEQYGLEVFDARRASRYGGSIRVQVAPKGRRRVNDRCRNYWPRSWTRGLIVQSLMPASARESRR
jgi:glycine/D-amino acid oxidase-like deaminating enzyme